MELAEFLGNIFLENDDYIDHIPRKAIYSYLKKIRNQKTWSIYFSKLTSILPNDHLYGATIRIYSIREQYNLLDELLGIYDEEYLISQLRLYSNKHVYREYVKYMVNCKNDLSEFYFAYNRYTGGRTSPLSISGSELECILNSYLINLYEKKDYTKIKIIIDSYNIYACFMESFLKLLIKSNDLFGLKYILKSHNSLVVTRDFNMITELISFAKEINVDKDIVKYLNSVSKVSVGSLVKSFAKKLLVILKLKKN